MASSFKSPILQAIDQNGDPVPGAKLYVYASGTTTPVAVFSNEALSVALPNPIIANGRGYFASAGGVVQNIFWNGQALRLRLTDMDDNVIWEIDNYTAGAGAPGGVFKSLAELKAVDPASLSAGDTAQLVAGGRSGFFSWVAGDQTSATNADPNEGMWVRPNAGVTTGAWRRINVPYVDGWVNAEWFGAVGNTVRRTQRALNLAPNGASIAAGSTALTTASSVFAATDVGKPISIAGAGAAGGALDTTIAAFISGTQVTLANAAGTTVGTAVRGFDGAVNAASTAFTSATASFVGGDVGRTITISGAGTAGAAFTTTIAAIVSPTVVTLTDPAVTTVTGATYGYGLAHTAFAFGTNDQPAFQAAVNWIASSTGKLRGGTVQYGAKSYWIDGTIAINERGITLRGHLGERTGASTISSANGGLLLGASTSGPVIGVWNDDIALTDVEIGATPGRQTAAIARSPRGTNCGVSIETADLAGTQIILRPTLTNVLVRDQPADGFLMQGEVIHTWLLNCTAINCGGHSYALDNGELVGRVNKGRPGIANFYNCRGFDAGGHILAIGHPSSGAEAPYRVTIMNFEGFRAGLTPAQLYDTAGWFLFGEQIISIGSASSGTGAGSTPANATLSVAGRDVAIRNHRYINGTKHVLLRQRAGLGTRLVHFDGGFASTTASPAPTDFIEVDAGVRQVRVTFVDGDFTNVIDDETIEGLVIDKPKAAPGGFSVFHRADIDFNNDGVVTNIRGSATTPFIGLFAGEYTQIAGGASSSQTLGMLRLTQNAAATGDASIRIAVGGNNWIFGQRRSNNTFCIRNDTGFTNAGNIVNIASDGGSNGFVGIGPSTNVPAYRVDVDGSINVRTGGAFLFAGTQVVGAQGAAIADAAGGTEITTINAILARLRAHGLIAT
jgi:hypothetical protein